MARPAVSHRRVKLAARATVAALLVSLGLALPSDAQQLVLQQQAALQVDPAAGEPGKDHNEFVYVRDSAVAMDTFKLAQRMERSKEWGKSADLYQEVMEKYRDRVIGDGVDARGQNTRYTSVAWGVLRQLAKWPQEGLEVYRTRYEPKAAALLAKAGPDDLSTLYQVFQNYFITESGKQAGLRLIDANIERGEFRAAAQVGEDLLSLYPRPSLLSERPAIIFRTAIAFALAGGNEGSTKAKDYAATLQKEHPNDLGTVRGKDVKLSEALQTELAALKTEQGNQVVTGLADSWPTFGGGPSRSVISPAKASPGTRLYSIPLAKPNYSAAPQGNRNSLLQVHEAAGQTGQTLGIMPVVDRGELFFQDGTRVYATNLESGVPLPGWLNTYPATNGQFVLAKTAGSARQYQQSLTVTDRHLLAVMGQPDRSMISQGISVGSGDARLVCLDRATGRENWTMSLNSVSLPISDRPTGAAAPAAPRVVDGNMPERPAAANGDAPAAALGSVSAEDEKAIRTLTLSGSPLVVGDSVLTIGRSARTNQGEDCYVLSFDIATGRFRWACYIASSGMPSMPMYGMQVQQNDNTSHLAYANGRVYVLTNLGAVAALDAYGGTIVWLNIYPLDTPQMNIRAMQLGMMDGRQQTTQKLKPWQHNSVMVSDGKVFALPTEGKNLLVYDANSGMEVKRIPLDVIGDWTKKRPDNTDDKPDRPKMLLAIQGEKAILAGDKFTVSIDWTKFNADTFPGTGKPDDPDQINWPWAAKEPLRGRPFISSSLMYATTSELMYTVDLKDGRTQANYPAPPRNEWNEGEEPGNLLVSGDHVIVAGASRIDVYTDLAIATAKLDAEVAAAPNDAEPRLRYAEVMFVAGQMDHALKRLDEAATLLGGAKNLRPGPSRDRLFNDALSFAVKSLSDDRPSAAERAKTFFDRAADAAGNADQAVRYRVARAKFTGDRLKDYAGAVRFYQEILANADMRAVGLLDEQNETPAQAAEIAERAIRKLGPAAYVAFEKLAKEAADAAVAKGEPTERAAALLEVSLMYPNSTVAQAAMLSAADAYESASRHRDAIRVYRTVLFKYQNDTKQSLVLEGIARNHLAVGDRPRGAMASVAAARLDRIPDNSNLTQDLKDPQGKVIAAAGTPVKDALKVVRQITDAEASRGLPDFKIPVPQPDKKIARDGFLKAPEATLLPDAQALVLPSRDFSRPDRVVTWSPRSLSFWGTGKNATKSALATSNAFPAQPNPPEAIPGVAQGLPREAARGVSWAGDVAFVWGGARVVAIDSRNGKTSWEVDVSTLSSLEVVRGGESTEVAAQPVVNNGLARRQVVLNGNVVQIQGNVVINGNMVMADGVPAAAPAVDPARAPALPVPPIPGLGEQIADVRPVGDRVLITTTAGRVLAADQGNGSVAWQIRLAEATPDRVVATEDFTVVRARDDSSVRLFAIDTYNGRIIGRQAFPSSGNNQVPLNLALSPDGKLVYTMPDQIRMRDLYDGWTGDEKSYSPTPPNGQAIRLFEGATQPGQLVIAEGRILAVADNAANSTAAGLGASHKYVSVYSLETVQPIPLRMGADANAREVNQMLTSGTNDWGVTLRTVGSRLYVLSRQRIFGYDLDRLDNSWAGSVGESMDAKTSNVDLRDVFIGTNYVVLLDQPNTQIPGEPPFKLYLLGRYPVGESKRESGKWNGHYVAKDASVANPQWQGADGGFYYTTADGKVKFIGGAAD